MNVETRYQRVEMPPLHLLLGGSSIPGFSGEIVEPPARSINTASRNRKKSVTYSIGQLVQNKVPLPKSWRWMPSPAHQPVRHAARCNQFSADTNGITNEGITAVNLSGFILN